MSCPACGTPAAEVDVFCRRCGADLRGSALPPAPSAAPPARPGAAPLEAPTEPVAQVTAPMPPPPPPTTAAPPPRPGAAPSSVAAPAARLRWGSYTGVVACGLIALAAGLPWLGGGGINVSAFEIPLEALWSDAADGVGLGFAFVLLGGLGLLLAAAAPGGAASRAGFAIAGAGALVVTGWFVVRLLSSVEGESAFKVMGFGIWVAGGAAVLALVSLRGARRRGA